MFKKVSTVIVDNYNVFEYTTYHKNMLMWSVAVGTLFGTFPFSWMYSQFGAKFVLLGAGLTSAFVTSLIPFAARNSFEFFLVLRFIQVSLFSQVSIELLFYVKGICYAAGK